ncbi:MAG: prepilin-type N-terminal cleavage/methylation domain-containing protein [Deltaproteobacteria bacterium]|nr:prepilin-type N-terminal cleavage/methylation domain-containing protein [Deltaproteobacteria bacterium]
MNLEHYQKRYNLNAAMIGRRRLFGRQLAILLDSKTGFSLVELIMAMGISMVILLAIYQVFTITSKNFTTQNVAANAQQSLRTAIGLMARDIRAAGLDPVDSDNFGFEYAASTKIRITADGEDGSGVFNGDIDEANFERITYEFQSNQIVQTLYEGTASQNPAPLIANINNLAFSYFDSNNNDLIDYGLSPPQVPADDLDKIRTVEISITVEEPAGNDEPISRTLTRRVECRNMAFN